MTGAYGSLAGDLAAVFTAAGVATGSDLSHRSLQALAERERTNWKRGVSLYSDVVPALRRMRGVGLRLVIVTNASAEAANVVGELGLQPMVDAVFASCDVGLLKPELLTVALGSLDAEANAVTAVDDEPAQLDGAAALGMDTILVRRGGRGSAGGHASSHKVVTDLGQAADLVGARGLGESQ